MITGTMQIIVSEQPYTVSPGDIFIVNPYEDHCGSFQPDSAVRYVHTGFDLNLFTGIMGTEGNALCSRLHEGTLAFSHHIPAETPAAALLGEDLMQILEAYQLAGNAPLTGDFRLFGALCGMISHMLEFTPPIPCSQRPHWNLDFIRAAFCHIENHYAEDLTTAGIAAVLGYSEGHFCTLFRQCFGASFTHYLGKFRVEQAISLLQNNAISLTEAAARVGFSNYSYFSRSFKKHVGVPPSEFFKQ